MDDRLYVLAFDHRRSLITSFFGVDGEPSAEDVGRARLAKDVIWEGLLRAIDDGVPRAFRSRRAAGVSSPSSTMIGVSGWTASSPLGRRSSCATAPTETNR